MASRKFTKVYVIVEDNHIFTKYNHLHVNMFRTPDDANRFCEMARKKAIENSRMESEKNKPLPQYKVHAFYLVHESLF